MPTKPTFDQYSQSYNQVVQNAISFAHQDVSFFTEVKAHILLEQLTATGLEPSQLNLLDVGCGIGNTDAWLIPHVHRVTGIDISTEEIRTATIKHPRGVYRAFDGQHIPFPDDSHDVAFAICVFHHVPPLQWESLLNEMRRVVRPGGYVMIFEHNPWNPLSRLAVFRCPFDKGVTLLTHSHLKKLYRLVQLDIKRSPYILFFPWRGRFWRAVEAWLSWLPLGAQYVVIGKK